MELQVPTRYATSSIQNTTTRTVSATFEAKEIQDTKTISATAGEGTTKYIYGLPPFAIIGVSGTFTNGGSVTSWNYSGATVTINYKATADGSATFTIRRISNKPTAAVELTLGSSVVSATYVSGTEPLTIFINPAGNPLRVVWQSDNLADVGLSRSCTLNITYLTSTTTGPYANVYFNGTRANYIYFNGTKYP